MKPLKITVKVIKVYVTETKQGKNGFQLIHNWINNRGNANVLVSYWMPYFQKYPMLFSK